MSTVQTRRSDVTHAFESLVIEELDSTLELSLSIKLTGYVLHGCYGECLVNRKVNNPLGNLETHGNLALNTWFQQGKSKFRHFTYSSYGKLANIGNSSNG